MSGTVRRAAMDETLTMAPTGPSESPASRRAIIRFAAACESWKAARTLRSKTSVRLGASTSSMSPAVMWRSAFATRSTRS